MQSMLPAVRVFGPALAGIISSIHPDCRIGLRRQDIADRVVLFIDYQNVYKTAREAFHSRSAPHWYGQIDPVALGELIVARSPFERTLSGVRIYRGIQDSAKDPKGYAASRRQITAWSRYMRVEVLTRTLRYPSGWPREKPMEKGIDVSLALDYALMAYRQEYDVGILMSTDTDLKPALEAVVDLEAARVEVAAWSSQRGHSSRLAIKSRKIWCHWLGRDAYTSVQDRRDYSRP